MQEVKIHGALAGLTRRELRAFHHEYHSRTLQLGFKPLRRSFPGSNSLAPFLVPLRSRAFLPSSALSALDLACDLKNPRSDPLFTITVGPSSLYFLVLGRSQLLSP